MVERTIRVTLVGDATSLVAAANQARNALNGLARVNIGQVSGGIKQVSSAAQQATTHTTAWGNALRIGLASTGIQVGVAGIVNGFAAIAKAGLAYQGNLNTLKAVTGANTVQMERLGAEAKKLGNDITIPGANAADAAEAMRELAKGGLDVSETQMAARGSLMLAAAAQVSGAQAANIQAKALNAFGLSADKAMHVADVLAAAANAASGEITDMAAGLQQSATVAKGFGISLDETAVVLALFAKNGVIGSDAGTSFKTMLTQLASPTKHQREAMEDLSLSVYNSSGRFVGMESVVAQLAEAHDNLTQAQYNQAAATLFGTDAIRAANILGEEGIAGFKEMEKRVLKQGAAAELAAAQTAGLNGALDRISNTAATAALNLFENLQPALIAIVDVTRVVTDIIGALVGWFFKLPGPLIAATAAFGVWLLLAPQIELALFRIILNLGIFTQRIVAAGSATAVAALGFNALKAAGVGAITAIGNALKTNAIGLLLSAAAFAISLFAGNTEDATVATNDYSEAVDKSTGALKENSQAIIANIGVADVTAYRDLGGAAGDWTLALMGNVEAQNRVHAEIQQSMVDALAASGAYDTFSRYAANAGITIQEFATGVLNGTFTVGQSIPAVDAASAVNVKYAAAIDSITAAMADGKITSEEYATVQQIQAALAGDSTAALEEQAKAIAKVYDELGTSGPHVYFKNNVDRDRKAIEQADLAAQSLTISLLRMHPEITAAQAARANAAAMRMIATSARQHDAALADVLEKEQALDDLRKYGSNSPGAIAKAEKSAQNAADNVAKAQKDATKATQDAADAQADAQAGVARSSDDAARSQEDAARTLQRAQEDSVRAQIEAQEKLNRVTQDPGSTQEQIQSAQRALDDAKRNGEEKVADAQRRVQDAARGAAESRAAAEKRVQDAADSAADAAESAAERVADAQDSAAEAQDNLSQTQADAVPTAADLADAQRAISDANDQVADSADSQADALDAAAQSAMDMAAAAYTAAVAQGDLGGASEAAAAQMDYQRSLFILSAEAAGYTHDQAVALADQYELVPDTVDTHFETAELEGAKALADELNKELDAIDNKTVRFKVVGNLVYETGINGNLSQEEIDAQNKYRNLHPGEALTQAEVELAARDAERKYRNLHPDEAELEARYRNLHPIGGRAVGGMVFGAGGPTDDKIPAWLSNGEFVINARQTGRHRSLLEAINGGSRGFAPGGFVGSALGVGAIGGYQYGGMASMPDMGNIAKAWLAMGGNLRAVWSLIIGPTFLLMNNGIVTLGEQTMLLDKIIEKSWVDISVAIKTILERSILLSYRDMILGIQTIDLNTALMSLDNLQAWTNIGKAVDTVVKVGILPDYRLLNQGTQQVGLEMGALYTQAVVPSWIGINTTIIRSWTEGIEPTFKNMGNGLIALGKSYQLTAKLIDITWQTIKQATAEPINWIIDTVWNNGVVPLWAKIKSWVPTVTMNLEPLSPLTLAGGGPVHGPGGPRDDLVPAYLSNGEYVVNARAARDNLGLLDQINARRYADGGLVDLWSKIPNVAGGVASSSGVGGAVGTGAITDSASFSSAFGLNPFDVIMSMLNIGDVPAQAAKGGMGQMAAGLAGGIVGALISAVKKALGIPDDGAGGPPMAAGGFAPGFWGPINTEGLAANTAAARDFIIKTFGISNIGGLGGGSVPGSDHPTGKALDVMIANYLSTAGIALGQSVADWFVGNPGVFGTKYVIWRDQENDVNGRGWYPYSHPSGNNDTLQHRDHVHLSFLTGESPPGQPGGFSAFMGDDANLSLAVGTGINPAGFGATRMLNTVDPVIDFGAQNMARGTAAMVGPMPGGGATERWRPLYTHAMNMLGLYTPAGLEKMMYQMFRESSGLPLSYAIDSNFYAGHPSKGLLQTIPGTFKTNAPPGYNTNIWDPLSNALASLRYIRDPMRYPGGPYDNGGVVPPGLNAVYNGLGTPEALLNDRQWATASSAMNYVVNSAGVGGGPIDIQVTFAGDGVITNAMAQTATVTVNGALVQTARVLATSRGQA